jgi:putative spermidine/putrescine transport system permease protein
MAASAGSVAIARRETPRLAVSPYFLLLVPLLVMLLALYAYPLANVLWVSFSDPTVGFGNYEKLVTVPGIRRMLWTTFKICCITTAFAMLFGYVVAYALIHVGDRQRAWMMLFVLVPFWVSVLARAFSWVTLLGDTGIVNSALENWNIISEPVPMMRNQLGVLIGMVHYMVPYAVLPLYAAMKGIDPRVVSAARGLGAGPFEAFWRVFLPLSMPGIVAAGVLVFILTLGFFVTPALLGGGKTIMIAEYVSAQILNIGRWGVGAMCATVLLVLVFLVLGIMSRFVDLRALFGAK